MSTAVIQVPVPVDLYQRLERAASSQSKSIEMVLSETLQIVLPTGEDLPATVRREIDTLDTLTDDTLRQIAFTDMSEAEASRLDELLDWQSIRQLTPQEQAILETLQAEYGRILVRKARAFALLAEHGVSIDL